jgi:hypothetical protein
VGRGVGGGGVGEEWICCGWCGLGPGVEPVRGGAVTGRPLWEGLVVVCSGVVCAGAVLRCGWVVCHEAYIA